MRGLWALWLFASVAALSAQESFEAVFRRGLVALNGGSLSEARDSLVAASRLEPRNPLVWAALAQAYRRGHEDRLATEAAGRAGKLAKDVPSAGHALALFYSESGDFAKAAAWERRYAAAPGADPLAAARAAELSLRAGEAQHAVEWAQAALKKDDTAAMHHLLGIAYAALNRPDVALPELRAAVSRDPKVEVFVFDLGQAQLHSGDFQGALTTFGAARKHLPRSAQIELAYGVAAYGERRFLEAVDAFLRVVELDPSVEQSYVFLAKILEHAEDRLPRVVAAYAAWRKLEPRNPLAPCLYARALKAGGGDARDVEAALRESIRLNAAYWESHFELGVLLAANRDWEAAAQELSRSIELNPNHAPAHFQLARVYDKLGQRELAQAERAKHRQLTAAETGVREP